MGCGQSKIEHEEGVTRCKERKELLKKAVASRNAFAAAHSGYAVCLRSTGAALSDFGQGEVNLLIFSPSSSSLNDNSRIPPPLKPPSSSSSSIPSSSTTPAVSQTPIDNPLPPPPPPLPDYQAPPLQRAVSMPDLQLPKKPAKSTIDESIREEEDGDADDEEETDAASSKEQAAYSSPAKRTVRAQVESSNQRKPATGGTGKWLGDYIFDTENMPVPSLMQPEIQQPVEAVAQETVQEKQKPPAEPTPPPAPSPAVVPQKEQKEKQVKKQKAVESKRVKGQGGASVNLLQVLVQLDDHFLKAYESAHEVSKMLEATRMHYHSNFADNRGHIDHSARVMRVITWNRSCKRLEDGNDLEDDLDNEEIETHATILDKMLAWEKKLFEEVKAGEIMKMEYQRKVASLQKQKKRNASSETLEKTKAAVSHLHTRYIVDMQSMDSTVSEINRLRDQQLYLKLVDLVDGMATMWETMHKHHTAQYKVASTLRNLDTSLAPKETTEQHYKRTKQLADVLRDWHDRFQGLVNHQKDHVQAMNAWLKLNLIPIESTAAAKEERAPLPPIHPLLVAWHDLLQKLPEDRARGAIHTFKEVVRTIILIQEDELKLKDKCEGTYKEYVKRKRAFDEWFMKHMEKRKAAVESNENNGNNGNADSVLVEGGDEMINEKKAQLESLITRFKSEEELYHRTCKQVREKSAGSLKTHLPELFRALSDFSGECSEMFAKLRAITRGEHEENVEVV